MASETAHNSSDHHVFDFKSFIRSYKERELLEKDIKSFVNAVSTGAVNDLQLCTWLCSVNEKPLKFCKLFFTFSFFSLSIKTHRNFVSCFSKLFFSDFGTPCYVKNVDMFG